MIKIANTATAFTIVAEPDELPDGVTDYQYALHGVTRNDDGAMVLTVVRDTVKGHSWSKERTGRLRLTSRDPKVLRHMPTFGATVPKDSDLSDMTTLKFLMPVDDKLKHPKASNGRKRQSKKTSSAPQTLLPLKELVPMVNAHKAELGDSLSLRIDSATGTLRASIELS